MPRILVVLSAILLVSCSVFSQSGQIQPLSREAQRVKLNGGLTAQLMSLGRTSDHKRITIVMKIANEGKSTVDLLMIWRPVATDNTGASYTGLDSMSGIAQCDRQDFQECVGTRSGGPRIPINAFTRIDPGVEITVNLRLWSGDPGNGPLVSVSSNLAYRIESDELKESTFSDQDKYKQVRMMNLSFQPTAVTDAK